MTGSSEQPDPDSWKNVRQTERWVRRYAQNRSLPVIVGLVVFVLLFVGIAVPSYWGGVAYREGNILLLAICIPILAAALAATIFISVPGWGARRLQQWSQHLYDREGQVSMAMPAGNRRWWPAVLAAGFALCVVGSVILGLLGYLPTGKYMQPISALYVVPFLVCLHFLMRPAASHIHLLWPLLYAVHAVLIVAGVPIVFTGPWESLNMLLPVVGYGILTALVGHAYSRWALYRLRSLAAQPGMGNHHDGP